MQQSAFALEFGELFSRLTIDKLRRMPMQPAGAVRAAARAVLSKNEAAPKGTHGKYANVRQSQSRRATITLAILDRLCGTDLDSVSA